MIQVSIIFSREAQILLTWNPCQKDSLIKEDIKLIISLTDKKFLLF